MKKLLFLVAAASISFAFAACGNTTGGNDSDSLATDSLAGGETAVAEVDPFPWDFPQAITLEDAEVGAYALSCYTFYPSAIEEGEDLTKECLIFYSGKLSDITEETTKVDGKEMPNALVIPIPAGQTAKKGDVLLTWWQSGSGMKRAYVVDDSDPTQPVVQYLDMDWKEEGDGFANKFQDQLKPNSFMQVPDGEWVPGAQVAHFDGSEWEIGILIHATEDKVLCSGWSSKVFAYDKSECKLVPANESLSAGDAVMAEFVGSYSEGYTVKKVDKSIGRVWVEKNGDEKILSVLQVTKSL